jgi:hypothetical protein
MDKERVNADDGFNFIDKIDQIKHPVCLGFDRALNYILMIYSHISVISSL